MEDTENLTKFLKEKRKSKRRSSIANNGVIKIANNCHKDPLECMQEIVDCQEQWLDKERDVLINYEILSKEMLNSCTNNIKKSDDDTDAAILSDEQKYFLNKYSLSDSLISKLLTKMRSVTIKSEILSSKLRVETDEKLNELNLNTNKQSNFNKENTVEDICFKPSFLRCSTNDPIQLLKEYFNS